MNAIAASPRVLSQTRYGETLNNIADIGYRSTVRKNFLESSIESTLLHWPKLTNICTFTSFELLFYLIFCGYLLFFCLVSHSYL